MRTLHTRTPFTFVRNAVGLVAFGLSAPLWGQQGTGREPFAVEPGAPVATSAFESREARRREALEKVIPEINVPAGETLARFADFLADKTGANIVLEESLKDMELPALKLRNVSITSALEAIRVNAKQSISVHLSDDRGPGTLLVSISSSRLRGEQKRTKICRVFRLLQLASAGRIVSADSGPGLVTVADKPADDEKTRKALAEKIQHISEAAEKACRTLALANGKTKADADYPVIEVHAPTHLLMVIGEETDVDVVAQIISGSAAFRCTAPNRNCRRAVEIDRP